MIVPAMIRVLRQVSYSHHGVRPDPSLSLYVLSLVKGFTVPNDCTHVPEREPAYLSGSISTTYSCCPQIGIETLSREPSFLFIKITKVYE
ncbi:hypothetical protein AVEN_125531-1 [Araneus ventricosus]|uniref:Uncharacterized protein n=1 Tax=Araneus ventricosus TaxID=182803 RepID=A0A4Y2AZU4_ARAVE|nr:hypothetical protein AVEN_125531-1 [Araneus ventricosus]